jgi:enoyl-CoA hydratase
VSQPGGDARALLVERRGPVALVTLNRPEKRNALSVELRRAIAAAFADLGADAGVAAAVLTGAGSAFCSGMDRTEFGGDEAHRRDLFESSKAAFEAVSAFPLPVVAAVNGPALGGGLGLAASCDIRTAGPAATFGLPEIALGIPASYPAAIRVLPDQLARELALTGRILSAEEALAAGLVREIAADPVARAIEMAEQMARHGRAVLASTKRLIVEANEASLAARGWEAELRLFREALFGRD